MYFRMLNDESTGELTYLLADLDAREAVLVDPRGRDFHVLTALLAERDLRLRWILRTHHHDTMLSQESRHLGLWGVPVVQGDTWHHKKGSSDEAVLPFGHEWVRVLATPGHTRHCLSFGWRDRLFIGGLLALQSCPYQPVPAAPEALWESVMQRIFTLPNETLLFSGHVQRSRAVSTVMEQRRCHPLFANLSRDEFLTQVAAMPDPSTDPVRA